MMALRVTATVSPPKPFSPPLPSKHVPSQKLNPNTSSPVVLIRPAKGAATGTTTVLTLFALFAAPPVEATALTIPKDQILSSLDKVESAVGQAQELGSNVFGVAGQVFGAVKPGIDAALPILKQAGEQALKISSPLFSEVSKKAQEAIQSSGIDTQPMISAAKVAVDAAQQTGKIIDEAKPVATSTVETISSADPIVILGTGGALVVAYLTVPAIFSAISFSLRGYKGGLTPAQALDLMCTKNYIMVDVRSEKDKNKAGVPRLPSSAKNKMISVPLEELPSKVRNLVRNVKKVEAELVALKISYLKRINKNSNIVIMDSYSDSAKTIARALTSFGFKNCWIVNDGFSGSKGWLQSRLGFDSYNLAFTEVLSPSRVISAAERRFGTTSSAKLLPGGSD